MLGQSLFVHWVLPLRVSQRLLEKPLSESLPKVPFDLQQLFWRLRIQLHDLHFEQIPDEPPMSGWLWSGEVWRHPALTMRVVQLCLHELLRALAIPVFGIKKNYSPISFCVHSAMIDEIFILQNIYIHMDRLVSMACICTNRSASPSVQVSIWRTVRTEFVCSATRAASRAVVPLTPSASSVCQHSSDIRFRCTVLAIVAISTLASLATTGTRL